MQAWVIYMLLRRHGQALLTQERLEDRLAGLERTLDELADWLYGSTGRPDTAGGPARLGEADGLDRTTATGAGVRPVKDSMQLRRPASILTRGL